MVQPHEIRKAGGMQSLELGSLGGPVVLMKDGRGWYHHTEYATPMKNKVLSRLLSVVEQPRVSAKGDSISTWGTRYC